MRLFNEKIFNRKMFVFKFVIFALLILFDSFSFAVEKLDFLEVAKGHHVAYDAQIFDSNEPTLILLPGIFRGLERKDIFIKKLIENRINFVTIHFSTQPQSVATYAPQKRLHFDGAPKISSEMFAREVEEVVKYLKVRKPLAISLSYSASISQYLDPKIFDLVLETAPIGRFDENDPESAELFKSWQSWLRLFPIWGPIAAEKMKDGAYRTYWSRVAKQYAVRDSRLNNSESLTRLTEGYMTMAKAVESFDLRTQNFVGTPYRLFILGANEEPKRREIQNEAVAIFRKLIDPKAQIAVIPGAGHVVPNDQPDLYLRVLNQVLEKRYVASVYQIPSCRGLF